MTVVLRARRLFRCVAALSLVGAIAHASPQIVLAQSSGAITLKATSRNVILDIAVTDYRGKPVTDLSDSDLVVRENGELQTVHIASASRRAGGSDSLWGTGSGSRTAGSIPHGRNDVGKQSAPPGPRAAITDGPRTVILLDEINVQFFDLAFARQRLEVFLRGPKAQGRPIAILAMTPQREILVHDFTTNTAALIDSLHSLPGVLPATGSGGMISGNVDAINDMENLQKSMGVLVQLASAFSGSGERVNVIWITSGFLTLAQMNNSSDVESTQDEILKRATNLFLSARMCLYTIDPHGVQFESALPNHNAQRILYGPVSAQALFNANTGGEFAGQTANMTNNQAVANSYLGAIDRISGGRAFGNQNDIDLALERVVQESHYALRVAYSPTNKSFDGKYRKITVTVNRPGLTARTRDGYYALQDPPEPTLAEQRTRIEAAIESPFAFKALEVSGELRLMPAATVQVHVAGPQIQWRYDDQGARVDQMIVLAAYSAENRALNSKTYDVSAKQQGAQAKAASVTYTVGFQPPPGTVRLRLAVSDRHSGQIGTTDVAFTAPDLERSPKPAGNPPRQP